jgi:hypothetical protein
MNPLLKLRRAWHGKAAPPNEGIKAGGGVSSIPFPHASHAPISLASPPSGADTSIAPGGQTVVASPVDA